MDRQLVIHKDDGLQAAFPVAAGDTAIGRAPDNLVQLVDREVSKHHAVIRHDANAWSVEDLESRNGLYVNGQKTSRQELASGDKIQIGPYEFAFEEVPPQTTFTSDAGDLDAPHPPRATLLRLIAGRHADDTIVAQPPSSE